MVNKRVCHDVSWILWCICVTFAVATWEMEKCLGEGEYWL